jgi:hypothetical protein
MSVLTVIGKTAGATESTCVALSIVAPDGLESVHVIVAPVVDALNSATATLIVAVLAAAGSVSVPDAAGVKAGATGCPAGVVVVVHE